MSVLTCAIPGCGESRRTGPPLLRTSSQSHVAEDLCGHFGEDVLAFTTTTGVPKRDLAEGNLNCVIFPRVPGGRRGGGAGRICVAETAGGRETMRPVSGFGGRIREAEREDDGG